MIAPSILQHVRCGWNSYVDDAPFYVRLQLINITRYKRSSTRPTRTDKSAPIKIHPDLNVSRNYAVGNAGKQINPYSTAVYSLLARHDDAARHPYPRTAIE